MSLPASTSNTPADNLQNNTWIAFARSEKPAELSGEFHSLYSRLGFASRLDFHDAMNKAMLAPIQEVIEELSVESGSPSVSARELLAAFLIRRNDYYGVSAKETRMIHEALLPYLPGNSPFHGYAIFHQSNRLVQEGKAMEALELLDNFEKAIPAQSDEVISIWQKTLVVTARCMALTSLGLFREATDQLEAALREARGLSFTLTSIIEYHLAILFRDSGQQSQAISIWQHPARVKQLKENQCWENLVVNYLNACRCSIDLKDAKSAQFALEEAERYLPHIDSKYPRLRGYLYLRQGELATLKEDYLTGEERLTAAIDYFEKVLPPCPEGWLESRIALGHYALLQDNIPLAWAIIKKLIMEAEELGHMALRSQALLMQTWFFVTDQPPGQDTFEEVHDQVRMIHNPALLFHAFSNLLTYAIDHLGESEAQNILDQMESLRDRLTDESYDQLLDKHLPSHLREPELEN